MSQRDRLFEWWARLALLLTLSSYAVAQPLYDLVGRFPTFFIYRHFQPIDFALFVALVSLLLPLAWWAVLELIALALPRRRALIYTVALGGLSSLAILPWIGSIHGVAPWVAIALSCAIGALAGNLMVKRAGVKKFVLLLTPSIVIFAVILLLRPGIKELWWPQSGALETGGAGGGTTPPIVILVLDALPTASLVDEKLAVDENRYPAFARLAREGTWYRRATTVSTNTTRAVPAIFSGRCPADNPPPTFESHPRSLFTFLNGTYDFDVVETVTQLCPPQLCPQETTAFSDRFRTVLQDASIVLGHRLVPPAWTNRLPRIDKNWGGFVADASQGGQPKRNLRDVEIRRYREMVGRIQATARPTLRLAHVVLPHEPFLYMPSGTSYRAGSEPGGSWRTLGADPWVAWHGYQHHLLQLGFVDRLLAELLGALDKANLYDESLVIVTADHGSAFIPGQPRRELAQTNVVDLVAVPLFVKLPLQRSGGAHDALVQSVDVLAIVADALGVPPPPWTQGHLPPEAADGRGGLSCREIRQQPAPLVTLENLQAAADRKTGQFGTGSAGLFPQVGPRRDLVGTSSQATSCASLPGVRVTLQNADRFEAVDPTSGFVPAEVVGTIYGPRVRELDLAVAVNGTVRATTRPYELGTSGATFAAVVPEDSFRPGRNDVEVFAAGTSGTCPLQPLAVTLDEDFSFLDTRLGAWADPRVKESGFAKTEQAGDTVLRWTRGRGRLEVPLSLEQAARLRAIRVDLRAVAREGSDVQIMIGQQTLFDGRVEEAPWSGTFPVVNWHRRGPARILIRSSTYTIGARNYGVGVEGVWLLTEDS